MSRAALYLASASPRRLELLRRCGLAPLVVPQSAPEDGLDGETPRDYVVRVAAAKAADALARLPADARPGVVLAADTTVTLDGDRLDKPAGPDEAAAMLRRLAGRAHVVWSGVRLLAVPGGRSAGGAASTEVRFRDLDEPTIREYVASGEPLDKAGAYGIQGRGALLVDGIVGSWSNVVGLPVERLPGWLAELGVRVSDLAATGGGQDDEASSS